MLEIGHYAWCWLAPFCKTVENYYADLACTSLRCFSCTIHRSTMGIVRPALRVLPYYTPPQPRLIGIHPHPGPPTAFRHVHPEAPQDSKQIPGLSSDYRATPDGQLWAKWWSNARGDIRNDRWYKVSFKISKKGTLMYHFRDDHKVRHVADLIAQTFLPHDPQIHTSKVEHINGDISDCSASNLRWEINRQGARVLLPLAISHQHDGWTVDIGHREERCSIVKGATAMEAVSSAIVSIVRHSCQLPLVGIHPHPGPDDNDPLTFLSKLPIAKDITRCVNRYLGFSINRLPDNVLQQIRDPEQGHRDYRRCYTAISNSHRWQVINCSHRVDGEFEGFDAPGFIPVRNHSLAAVYCPWCSHTHLYSDRLCWTHLNNAFHCSHLHMTVGDEDLSFNDEELVEWPDV